MIAFNHFNFNVLDLDKNSSFYKKALDLEPVRGEKTHPTGALNSFFWEIRPQASHWNSHG